ncbi:hypothetical protein Glove_52g87 [Diversispora epigaea]|uniref:Protein kinase domain-containing protein n=1 Tax=Diversispora epigaea TaxID=1348612 RepID=A0A397JFH3_9GLOM|nr:hypothetical protein Glove_52g87 [Diversispora epigaea]
MEWIPYDRLKDIEEIAKGGFGTICKAKWIDGPIEEWDLENEPWTRYGQLDVALKKFDNNFANLNEDFLNENAIKHLLRHKFIQNAQQNSDNDWEVMEWIPYDRLKDIEEIAKGGFGTICKAKWIDGPIEEWDLENEPWTRYGQLDVALKKFDNNFANLNEDFLNEIAIHLKASSEYASLRFYGITQDLKINEYIMVLEYMNGGNPRDYLKKDFNNINWSMKLEYLKELASDFKNIHKLDIMHHDFHPGNILLSNFKNYYLCISDFGLTPEVLSGEEYTKAADVYSFGMIAYEMVTGFAPYYNVRHDRDLARQICNGLRPKIPFHIPKLITRMIMRCWGARITHRPTFLELFDELFKYYVDYFENIKSKRLGNSTTPTPMNYETHPEAIYTSRLFNYSILPKLKDDENFAKELEKSTISTSALSASLRESFEECAIQLHHYNYTSQDEIDKECFGYSLIRDELDDLFEKGNLRYKTFIWEFKPPMEERIRLCDG